VVSEVPVEIPAGSNPRRGRISMERFGLFEWRNDGLPHWVDAAADVQQARKRIRDWALASPESEYFAQDFIANVVVASTRDYLLPRGAAAEGPAIPATR
jgi:hypothetical protein